MNADLYRGVIPRDWLERRQIASVRLNPRLEFVDLSNARTIHYLRRELADLAVQQELDDIDLGAMIGPQRRITQEVARIVYDRKRNGKPAYAGVRYVSRLGLDWECWAAFDNRIKVLGAITTEPITINNPDLVAIKNLLDLEIS